jgi:PIN domain nuclease of toxin-antitoxin system
VNLLLDTPVVLWWLADDRGLSGPARKAIADADNTVYLGAVVVWELWIKHALGKVELPGRFRAVLDAQPFVSLSVTVEHAHAIARLPPIHRDPFDRMLVAQAQCEGLAIVTRDSSIADYDVTIVEA